MGPGECFVQTFTTSKRRTTAVKGTHPPPRGRLLMRRGFSDGDAAPRGKSPAGRHSTRPRNGRDEFGPSRTRTRGRWGRVTKDERMLGWQDSDET
jgi:hypothetical protein